MGKALVFGLGISGIAAAEFLRLKGYSVIGVDKNSQIIDASPECRRLQEKGIIVQIDTEDLDWVGIELLILSPGVTQSHPLCQRALQSGIEIIGEAELAFRYLNQKCVGITGTNGKTTVTLLAEHVLNASGIKAKALGNVGEPLTKYVLQNDPEEVVVAEISSYQLETMKRKSFDAAVIMNITPDHLDRYSSMEEYARAKCRILSCLKDRGVLYVHENIMSEYPDMLNGTNVRTFGSNKAADLWTDKRAIWHREKVETLLPVRYRELGIHESENALAVWSLCRAFGVTAENFLHAVEIFKKPPHRIEFVASFDGVIFYDDSKGTNIDAVIQAVGAMRGPVILIAGGVDKGASYLPWQKHLQGKIKKIIAIGQASSKIERELCPYFEIEMADSLAKAVAEAAACAVNGDHVLLSLGCSSYDMFRDYTHRGREFQRYVQDLVEERRKKK